MMRRAAVVLCMALAATSALALPAFDEVRAQWRSSETQVLSREGEVIERVRTDASVRRGRWLQLAEVSPALRRALVLSEDKRFYAHSGVDWAAVSAAAWGRLWHERTRGASTITMQLAGLIDDDLALRGGGRSMAQKLEQAVAAQVLDRRWRKDEILEAYLNLVPFRGELVGIDALSRTLFAKAAHGLDAQESALAAALVRAPNARPRLVAQRACGVLRLMRTGQPVDCAALELLAEGALRRRAWPASDGIAPHFARQWLRGQPAEGARSALSAPLQRFAQATLVRRLRELAGRNVHDGALVVLDNASGEVLAWVGSSGSLSDAAEVDGVLALRQPGSTLKPFLYAQAIAQKRLTAASLIEDSPAQIAAGGGLYIPQNYDLRFKGWVSVRTALAASLNVPAVRTLVMVTPDAFFEQLRMLGMGLPESGGYYGYSLALGSPEVRLLDLANAYRALASGGVLAPVSLQALDAQAPLPRGQRVLDAAAAFIVGDILADANARVVTFGPASVLDTRFWSAVKTGTSKDMRDNWALGWSGRYTVGVWVGNASGAPMHDVSGTSGAAPIWADVMRWLHARQGSSSAPTPPAGVVQQPVRFADSDGGALEAARSEWFVQGTQQAVFALQRPATKVVQAGGGQALSARITAPADGTIVALDPDIPPESQRLFFEASGQGALHWRIDGRSVGQGARLAWLPWPGQHRVQLVDAGGRVLDEVGVQVRGAAAKRQPPQRGGAQ